MSHFLKSEIMVRPLILFSLTFILTSHHACHAEPGSFLKKENRWFTGEEALTIAHNILSFQSDLGGWPRNISTTERPYKGDRKNLKPTYDNGATTDELRFLARMFNATKKPIFKAAFDHGLSYILKGQYSNGGWPQFHPPGKGYHRHITFNDNAMVRILEFLREIHTKEIYQFVSKAHQTQTKNAFEKGIDCILKCQIQLNGRRTAWCAQHNEKDFQPQSGRSYELISLSGSESVGIVRLLMSIKSPSSEMINAIESAIDWFESSQLIGIRLLTLNAPKTPRGRDKIVVNDKNAPPLWARFYSLKSSRPMFVDRDGIPKDHLADIGYERRNGYAWYGTWPQRLIEHEYPAWKKRRQKN